LELFSLEREGRPVAGRPFRLFLVATLRFAPHRYSAFFLIESISAPNASRSARGRPRGVNNSGQNLSRARLAPHRYTVFSPLGAITLLRQQARRMIGLALNLYYWSLRDKPLQSIYVFDLFLLLMQAARHMVSLAA